MTHTQLLRLWELCHGPMDARARELFLESPEISTITSFDATTIVRMIRTSRNLGELASALETEPRAGRRRTPPNPDHNLYARTKSFPNPGPANAASKPRKSKRRRPDDSDPVTSLLRRPRPSSLGKAPSDLSMKDKSADGRSGTQAPRPDRKEQKRLRDIAKKHQWDWED